MRSKNSAPTAAQKRWWSDLVEMGCLFTGEEAELDHLVGATVQQNGINIGNWFCIALCPHIHRTGPINRTMTEYKFISYYLNPELWQTSQGHKKELFFAQCQAYVTYYKKPLPFDMEVMQAIFDYQ